MKFSTSQFRKIQLIPASYPKAPQQKTLQLNHVHHRRLRFRQKTRRILLHSVLAPRSNTWQWPPCSCTPHLRVHFFCFWRCSSRCRRKSTTGGIVSHRVNSSAGCRTATFFSLLFTQWLLVLTFLLHFCHPLFLFSPGLFRSRFFIYHIPHSCLPFAN